MRVLVVSAVIPFPPIGGGKLRTFHLTRALAADHDVTLAGFCFGESPQPAPFPLQVVALPYESPPLYRAMEEGDDDAYERLQTAVSEPWFASYFDCRAMEEELRRLASERFDLVLMEGSDMGRFAPLFGRATIKALDFMDVHSRMAERLVERKSGIERVAAEHEAARILRFERRIAAESDLCLACSDQEAQAITTLLAPRRVVVVPNGVDTKALSPSELELEPGCVLFTGSMDFEPNIEAVEFFSREVFPRVRQKFDGAEFHIVGAKPTDQVKRLAAPDVVIHGFVPEMRPYFARASVFVAPILHGGGTRLKILEAAASAKAIVTTSLGVEGLDFRNGQDLIIADAPGDFADAVIALLRDGQERQRLGANARVVSEQYDWEKIGAGFRTLIATWP